MTERETGGGGLTGATGDLTFEETDRPFVPGETREVADPARRADVTVGQGGDAGGSRSGRTDGTPQVGGDEIGDREEHL